MQRIQVTCIDTFISFNESNSLNSNEWYKSVDITDGYSYKLFKFHRISENYWMCKIPTIQRVVKYTLGDSKNNSY